MEKIVLQAKNLSKSFNTPTKLELFQEVNFSCQSGESVAILGRSGEGKSTLLHILGTLDQPTTGTVSINEQTVSSANCNQIRREQIGFVFQAFHLLQEYSVLENVLMPAKIAGYKINEKKRDEAKKNLKLVGLSGRENFLTKQLSGGEKQRVAIARAICNRPKIIFADEPTGNLDSSTSELIQKLLFQLNEQGTALIIVTHDLKLANQCHSKYELKNGSLIKAI